MDQFYEYRHLVGSEEVNLLGNVSYVDYLRWQGRCREMFLRERAPAVLEDLREDLRLFTLKVECELLVEIGAFDEISIRMRLEDLTQTQIGFAFDYVRLRHGREELIARGRQRIACMRGPNTDTKPTRVPEALRAALANYALPSVPAPALPPSQGRYPARTSAPRQTSDERLLTGRGAGKVDVVGRARTEAAVPSSWSDNSEPLLTSGQENSNPRGSGAASALAEKLQLWVMQSRAEGIPTDQDITAVAARTLELWTPKIAEDWLFSPNAYLSGARPADTFVLEGATRVLEALDAAEDGTF